MLSFRVADDEAAETRRWAERLGIDRSELLRDALHRRLTQLRTEAESRRYDTTPMTDDELSFREVADWGPADDWSDWSDAPG